MEEATSTPAAEAVESGAPGTTDTASVMDGGTTQETTATATPDAGTAEQTATAASEESAQAKTDRRQRQREARKQDTPPPAPAPTPDQIIAAYERNRQEQERTQREHQARIERSGKWLGETPVTVNGERLTEFESVRREALRQVEPGTTYEDLEVHNKAVARYNELTERRDLLASEVDPIRQTATKHAQDQALAWVGNQFEQGLAEVGVDIQAVLSAGAAVSPEQRMPAIVKALAAQIEAKHAPRTAELEDDLTAMTEERNTWRTRAGGNAEQVLRGGTPGGVGSGRLSDLLNAPDFAERAMRGDFAHIDLTK